MEDKETLLKWDEDYLWHPFTQMKEYFLEDPLLIKRGKGCYLQDVDGNWYLDAISSLWLNVHGHAHPKLTKALQEQAEIIAHSTMLGMSNVPAVKLAKRLIEIVPEGLKKVFYSDDGSTSVEIALKMSYQYWQQKDGGKYKSKKKFISLSNAYHGDTVGSVSVGGIDLFHQIYEPLLFKGEKIPSPYCYRCQLQKEKTTCNLACLDVLEKLLQSENEKLAALIAEPLVQGAAGMIMAPLGYLKRVRELCTKYNVLLITDEVATGFGKTGTMFACEQEGVKPDILCMSKGITGGYLPLAATVTTDEIYNAFLGDYSEQKTFFHGHSYTGNQLACSVALANLDLFAEPEFFPKLQRKISYLAQKLASFAQLEHVGEVRQRGMMIGIELVADKKTKKPYDWSEKIGYKVCQKAREEGVLLRPLDNVIVLMPILASEESDLEKILTAAYNSIKSVTEDNE